MEKNAKIFIAGHNGMVGSAIFNQLNSSGYENIIVKTRSELDLTNQNDVNRFFESEVPDYVVIAAAKVGGILANNIYRAEFIYENLMIQNNIIHSAHKNNVKKLLFLGSSCIYPKNAPQPLKEEYLLTGELENTNEPYAIAKIAGIKMCENYYSQYNDNFISVMPTNLYGPNDNYDLEKSHVLPALIRKFHLASKLEKNDWVAIKKDLDKNHIEGIDGNQKKQTILNILEKYGIKKISESNENTKVQVSLWGSGKVFREFLHVDDMANASIHLLKNVDADKIYKELNISHINIGTGTDLTIYELANLVKEITKFKGDVKWDSSKPDGTKKKLLDVSILKDMNWNPSITLKKGIKEVYENYQV